MILLNLKLDKIYGFEDFEIEFTYPKKIVDSIIEEEHLDGRERFRYKKAVILMGANATGKTSMGKVLLNIFRYINTENPAMLYDMVSGDRGTFEIDLVNEGYVLHRLHADIDVAADPEVFLKYEAADIEKMDSYEKCVSKLEDKTALLSKGSRKIIGRSDHRFAYPEIEPSLRLEGIDKNIVLKTLRAVIGTLDPTFTEVVRSKDLKDTFIIRRKDAEIIIQDGKLYARSEPAKAFVYVPS